VPAPTASSIQSRALKEDATPTLPASYSSAPLRHDVALRHNLTMVGAPRLPYHTVLEGRLYRRKDRP